jgi:phospholipid-binding lipoprotein MlaA
MGLPMQQEDFGQTLGAYGVPAGPYVVLPLLGASLPRDAVGRIFIDHYFSPLSYIDYSGSYYVSLGARVFSTIDGRARAIETIRDIERNSVDQYVGMRDAYIKHRQDQVDNLTPQDLGIDPGAN